jgi:hypothetical protein
LAHFKIINNWALDAGDDCMREVNCPYGKPGDQLWVRETWTKLVPEHFITSQFVYKADCCLDSEEARLDYIKAGYPYKWKPSIQKAAARIWLEITDIRVERLQDISSDDAMSEGINKKFYYEQGISTPESMEEFWAKGYYQEGFKMLWKSINGNDSWNQNPWVWVVSFKVLSTTGKGGQP